MSDSQGEERRWQFDKKVSIALILLVVGNIVITVASYVRMQEHVKQNSTHIMEIKQTQADAIVKIERSQTNAIAEIKRDYALESDCRAHKTLVEAQITAITNLLSRTESSMALISQKLDRVIEKQLWRNQ